MRIILLTTFLTIAQCAIFAQQMPSCIGNPPAGNTCATATPICDLDGYCGNTSTSVYTSNSWSSSCGFLGLFDCGLTGEFCGSIENNSFLTYVASSSTISFNVWVFNSQYGDGIQIMVFSATGCSGNITNHYCNGQMVPTGTNSYHTVTVNGLTPGNTYYIMIDGFAGDVCDYVIGAGSGISVPVQVNPETITVCPGETVPLTASGGNGMYSWNATPELNTTSGANVIATPPVVPGTYTYTVNSATGNPLCPSATTAVATIIVDNCGCIVNATNSGNVCPGGTVDLFASDLADATYAWTSTFGFSSETQNPTGVVMPLIPGSYDITVTATVNGEPCSSTTTVVVHPLPTVGAGNDQSVCFGSSVTLNGTGANTYTWDGGISNGVSFTPTTGVNVYTVTGTSINGCVNSDDVTITVNDLPIVSAGTYPSVCQDVTNVVLSGTPAGGAFSGTGVIGNNFNTSSGTQQVTYSYTDGNNCTASDATIITVNPLPVVNAGSDLSICQGGSTVISASGTGSVSWSPSTGLSETNILNPTASPAITTTYTLTIDDGQCSNSDQMIVFVSSPAVLSITENQSICEGECTTISVSGATYYQWTPSSEFINPNLPEQSVCPLVTTSYYVTGYVAGGNSVANGDFSGGAVDFVSDYILNPDTQTEGTYFVTTNASFTHPGFSGVDHTTGTGNFLIVNGSGTPNSSVWCQTISVQTNTDYVFSTWVSTLAAGSPAILQFSINGSNLASPFTAPSSTGVWNEFYATWNSGVNTTATICIVNQNTSLTGNDFGLDDIFFAALCSSTASVTIAVNPLPQIDAGSDVTVCEGTSVTLNGSGGASYNWTNGGIDGQPFTQGLGSLVYTVTGTDANGCVGTDDVTVNVISGPTAIVNSDIQTGLPPLEVNFTNSSMDATSYTWIFGNGQSNVSLTTNGQSMVYNGTGTYIVQLIADNGYCTSTDTLHIVVFPFPDPIVFIPNVFSPNGDGVNDNWMIETQNVESINISILNRWGNVLAEITKLNQDWDGTINGNEASDGVYFYIYKVIGINGNELTGHGNVTLVR